MSDLSEVLEVELQRAEASLAKPLVNDPEIVNRIEYVCRQTRNRSGSRFLLACLLAKIDRPEVDIRKPFEMGSPDSYSGRKYDEVFVQGFVTRHKLPCNPTTAFLTPAYRTKGIALTPAVEIIGRPKELYRTLLLLLESVYRNNVASGEMLAELIRWLLIVKNENEQRIASLLADLRASRADAALSAETIVTLVQQHMAFKGSSRLPVLVVAAAYRVGSDYLGERALPLELHNAADKQTGALGDVQITLVNDDKVVTAYEMKMKRVTTDDIDQALRKIAEATQRVDHYVFITTDVITDEVREYALGVFDRTGGIELVVLGCIGFLRHFLHLFHRLRIQFLEAYQELVLTEPESAVNQPLKEAFLTLRRAAESVE